MTQKFINTIAKQAGRLVLGKFGKVKAKYYKGSALDAVSEADLLSNRLLVEKIKKKFPTHGIISEELGKYQEGAKHMWFIDPLDGTMNFLRGTPLFAVVVGFAINGKMELGTVFDPVHNELFFAQRGKGAFLNGKKIHCSSQLRLGDSYGGLGAEVIVPKMAMLLKMAQQNETGRPFISILGSGPLIGGYVAAGRRDWLVFPRGGIWDYAAPSLILKEAGCKVTNFKGKPWTLSDTTMVAANPKLHPALLKLVN